MPSAQYADNDFDSGAITLGRDLRGLRKSRGLTLSELALKIGRSVGFLSQVERGMSSPSIDDLRALSGALNVPLSWFFANDTAAENERGLIVRSANRRVLGTREDGITEELLSPDLTGTFEMFRTEFAPLAALKETVRRRTEESGFIVSGCLDLWIDETLFQLQAGDSFRFYDKPYRWKNPSNSPTVAIWVVSPPVY
jgi:transcriptional regulator with XRE-family HTH domain